MPGGNGRSRLTDGTPIPPQVRGLLMERELMFLRLVVGDVVMQVDNADAIERDINQCRACGITTGLGNQLCARHQELMTSRMQRWMETVGRARAAVAGRTAQDLLLYIQAAVRRGNALNERLQRMGHNFEETGPHEIKSQNDDAAMLARYDLSHNDLLLEVQRKDEEIEQLRDLVETLQAGHGEQQP